MTGPYLRPEAQRHRRRRPERDPRSRRHALHDYAINCIVMRPWRRIRPRLPTETATRERPRAPVSARLEHRRPRRIAGLARSAPGSGSPIVGATGLRRRRADPAARPPSGGRRSSGSSGRDRDDEPVGGIHPHLATTPASRSDADLPTADAVFLALPHGVGRRARPGDRRRRGARSIDLGPDFRLRDAGRLPALVRLRASAPGAARDRRLRAARAPSRRARGAPRRAGPRSSAHRAAIRPRPSSRSPRSPGPGSSATSSSTPRAACRAPAASRSPT